LRLNGAEKSKSLRNGLHIEAYIAQDSPIIARNFISLIFDRIDRLANYTESGKVVREFNNETIRELLLKKYRIVYQIISEEEVIVLRIVHSSRLLDLDIE
jgi:plasmid stabilization system protein ParE